MAESSIARALTQALNIQDSTLGLRPELDPDYSFIADLYAEVRHDELAPVPWSDQAKREFLDAQCRLQHDHYVKHYPGADLLIITRGDRAIGRIYLRTTTAEIRLMDIALRGEERNKGIGERLVRTLQAEASRRAVELTLHVEPTNPAQRLYQRLGFRLIENRGVYDFLGWPEAAAERIS